MNEFSREYFKKIINDLGMNELDLNHTPQLVIDFMHYMYLSSVIGLVAGLICISLSLYVFSLHRKDKHSDFDTPAFFLFCLGAISIAQAGYRIFKMFVSPSVFIQNYIIDSAGLSPVLIAHMTAYITDKAKPPSITSEINTTLISSAFMSILYVIVIILSTIATMRAIRDDRIDSSVPKSVYALFIGYSFFFYIFVMRVSDTLAAALYKKVFVLLM